MSGWTPALLGLAVLSLVLALLFLFMWFRSWRLSVQLAQLEAGLAAERSLSRREAELELERWKMREEKSIRKDAVTRSAGVNAGQIFEHFAPFTEGFPFNPKDARFLGSPVDFVIFDGLDEGALRQIVFVEVKTGTSKLSRREQQVRDIAERGEIGWLELRP